MEFAHRFLDADGQHRLLAFIHLMIGIVPVVNERAHGHYG
jgi:hypothetical protein